MAFSLPGLGSADDDDKPTNSTTTTSNNATQHANASTTTATFHPHTLSARTEFRFEVPPGALAHLRLLTGTAEIFGTELVPSSGGTPSYTFGGAGAGAKLAVFTWHGCAFELAVGDGGSGASSGSSGYGYTGEETTMEECFGTHAALQSLRDGARRTEGTGPRVLVVGPEGSGKSTLCKILTAYAVRDGQSSPVVVNLDVLGEGVLSLPGTMSAGVFKSGLDLESVNGWGESPMSGPSGSVPVKLPLVYHFGMESVLGGKREEQAYISLTSALGLAVLGRLQGDSEARPSGLIIDTPGALISSSSASSRGGGGGSMSGYDLIAHIISEFAVNAVICLGSERLYSDMVKRFDGQPSSLSSSTTTGETISVVKLNRSGGCVERDAAFMASLRAAQVKSYFYGGNGGVVLSPRQQSVEFATLTVYRIVTGSSGSANYGMNGGGGGNEDEFAPGGGEEFYPGGDDFSGGESKVALPATQLLERITSPSPAMQSSVLAIMNIEAEADEGEIRRASVMGYVYVTEVDEARGRIGLLSPVAGRIPARALLWGPWPEGVLGLV